MSRSETGNLCAAIYGSLLWLFTATTAAGLQTTVGGRQVDLDATLLVRQVIEQDRATTLEHTLEQLRLRAAVSLTNWLRFDSTTVGSNGGPTREADHAGVYNFTNVFQDISPSAEFEEAYFDVFLPSVDLRLGLQKVAWGKLDRFQPNDLINSLSYLDPFLQEEAERKIGVPAVQASYYLPAFAPAESRLTAVWVPKYVPYRFGLASCTVQGRTPDCNIERWFPPAALPPPTFTVPGDILGLPSGQSLTVPLALHVQNLSPAWRFNNSDIGLRYSALVHDVDFALYYYHGFDPQPAFNLQAFATGSSDLKDLMGSTTLSPVFKQIDSGGADFTFAINRFTLRGEGAFVAGRPFPVDLTTLIGDPRQLKDSLMNALAQLRNGAGSAEVVLPQPSFAVRNALEWGIGGDWVYEGYFLLLQVNQTDVFHNDVELLIKNVDTRLLANLRKNFFADTLQTQLVALQGIESGYTMLRFGLRYRITDHIAAGTGYLFIAGRSASLVGQYKRNGEGWVLLEYSI